MNSRLQDGSDPPHADLYDHELHPVDTDADRPGRRSPFKRRCAETREPETFTLDLEITTARVADADAIVVLLNAIIRAGTLTSMDSPVTVEHQRSFIQHFPSRGVFHIARCAATDAVLGVQDVLPISQGERALSHVGAVSTFVALNVHRRGVGRALTEQTCQAARRMGYRKLLAWIRADNRNAVAFYASMGFDRVGIAREHVCVRGRYLDEVLMERSLIDGTR